MISLFPNDDTQMLVSRFNAHDRTEGKEEWLTPKFIIDALKPFDLDPCASNVRPWEIADNVFTIQDNGLIQPWHGFVWCNPPYGGETQKWFRRMKEHGNGIALTFARTETRMFFDCVWGGASAILFLKGRLRFCNTKGEQGGTAGAPSVLIAYGQAASERLRNCKLEGKFIQLITYANHREETAREDSIERRSCLAS